MKDKIKLLKDSPIFAMSLGSKELFHSNFWAWLIEQNHQFSTVFFPKIKWTEISEIKRESNNRDLTIVVKDGLEYIVENKIKSLPGLEQLKKYENTNTKEGLLTGIISTIDLKNDKIWKFLSYQKIGHRILNLSTKLEFEHKEIVIQYCKVIELINAVLLEQLNSKKYQLNFDSGQLSDIRMDDIFKKLKANEFYQSYINNNKDLTDLIPDGFYLELNTDFSNKHAIIDIRFINRDSGIGIQIEEYQFRLVAFIKKPKQCEELFKEYSKVNWFDLNYSKDNKKVFGFDTKMQQYSRKYNKYETAEYSFVYQYFDITEELRYYTTLYEQIIFFLNKAKEVLNKKN